MRKIITLLLAVTMLLCGCQNNGIADTSSISQNSENSSVVQNEEVKLSKYQGRENYENISLGYTGDMTQDAKYYYYADEYGFFSVDKKSGERRQFSNEFITPMLTFNDEIYFTESGTVLVFDKKSQCLVKKSYTELFSLELKVPQERYDLSVLMVKDGWLVSIEDKERDTHEVYLTDRDFTSKKLLPIHRFDFVLGDEIFYLLDDGNVACYNIVTDKHYYVTKDFDLNIQDEYVNGRSIQYVGKGKLLVYGNKKLNIINLVDGSTWLEIPYSIDDYIYPPSVACDDNKIYMMVESERKYCINAISYDDKNINTIYFSELSATYYNFGIENIDEQYLYLYKAGYSNDDGTPSGEHIRINKDGSGEKLLFKQIAT